MKKILFFSFLSFFSFQKENYAIKIEGFEKDQRHVVLREVESKKAVFNQWTHSGAVILDPNQYAEGLYEFASAAPSADYVPNFLAYIHPKLPEGIAIIATENNILSVNTFKKAPPIYMCLVPQNDQKEKIEQGYTYGMGFFKNLKYENYFLYLSGPELSLEIPIYVPHNVSLTGFEEGTRLVRITNELTNEVIYKEWNANGTILFKPARHYFKQGIYKIETAESGKNFELDSLLFIDPRLPAGVVHGRIEDNTLEINTFFEDKNLKAYLKPAHDFNAILRPAVRDEVIVFEGLKFQNYFLYFENEHGMMAEISVLNPKGIADGDLFIDDTDEEDNDILFQFPPKPRFIPKGNLGQEKLEQKIPFFKQPIPVDNAPDPLLKQKMKEGNYAGDYEENAAKASVENLYKIVKPYDGMKALREITRYIHELKRDLKEKDKFKRFDNYKNIIADELDNALHALSGPAESWPNWPNFEGNEYWNTLKDGTAVHALGLLGRVWNAILTYPLPEEERSMMKKTLVARLGYCVEDPGIPGQQGQRICIKGKVKYLLLALQGHIPGIMIDRPDPKTFVPNFIQRLADKTKENEALHDFLWLTFEKGQLKEAEFNKFIRDTTVEFNKALNEIFANHEQDLRVMALKEFNEQIEEWRRYFNSNDN